MADLSFINGLLGIFIGWYFKIIYDEICEIRDIRNFDARVKAQENDKIGLVPTPKLKNAERLMREHMRKLNEGG